MRRTRKDRTLSFWELSAPALADREEPSYSERILTRAAALIAANGGFLLRMVRRLSVLGIESVCSSVIMGGGQFSGVLVHAGRYAPHCCALTMAFSTYALATWRRVHCYIRLGGCSSIPDELSVCAAPGKFDFLDCPRIASRSVAAADQESELKNLMTRANEGAGGAVVNAFVYQDRLNTVGAERRSLQKAAEAKGCPPQQ
jgi:hypothetical protein